MNRIFRNFTRAHLYIFLGFYFVFAAMTFFILSGGSDSNRQSNAIVAGTLGVVSGLFTGAIARHFQSCCWKFSLTLAPYCGIFLGAGVFLQLIPLRTEGAQRIRLAAWAIGLFGWYAGGLLSLVHALS